MRDLLTSATFAADMATFSYLNLIYLFYSCTNLATITGLGNLSGVRQMPLHVQLVRGHDARLPGLRSVHADGPVLLLLGMLVTHDDLCGFDLDAAFERNLGTAVLLQLQQACRW